MGLPLRVVTTDDDSTVTGSVSGLPPGGFFTFSSTGWLTAAEREMEVFTADDDAAA